MGQTFLLRWPTTSAKLQQKKKKAEEMDKPEAMKLIEAQERVTRDDPKGFEMLSHYAVLIDVAGESQDNELRGILVHAVIPRWPHNDQIDCAMGYARLRRIAEEKWIRLHCDGKGQWVEVNSHGTTSPAFPPILLGKVSNTGRFPTPRSWAWSIGNPMLTAMNALADNYQHRKWSADINCQTFAVRFCSEMGIRWPDGVRCSSDVPPIIVNCFLGIHRHTAQTSAAS